MRCCYLNSESNDSTFVSSFWAWPKVMGSSIFVSSSDKRVESFVIEAFATPLLRRSAAVVGAVLDMSFSNIV